MMFRSLPPSCNRGGTSRVGYNDGATLVSWVRSVGRRQLELLQKLVVLVGFVYSLTFLPAIGLADSFSPYPTMFGDYYQTLRAARAGSIPAQNQLGTMLITGYAAPKDPGAAAAWFEVTALRGSAVGQLNLGMLYLTGEGVQEDVPVAVDWIRKAAENGYPKAQNLLGYFYEEGIGVDVDPEKAVNWYNKASIEGNFEAKSNLVRLGLSVPPTKVPLPPQPLSAPPIGKESPTNRRPTAIERPVIENKKKPVAIEGPGPFHPNQPQTDLGPSSQLQSITTPGMPPLPRYAQNRVMAVNDNLDAQKWLGAALSSRVRNTIDLVATAGWFYAAARQGHTKSQVDLGMMYLIGLGVEEDPQQAALYFSMAAEEDHPEAQMLLARLHLWGTGVERNPVKALKWYAIADGNGHKGAKKERRQLLDTLEPAQIVLANQEIESFRVKRLEKLKSVAEAKAKAEAEAVRAAREEKAAAIRIAQEQKAEAARMAQERKAAAIRLAKERAEEVRRLAQKRAERDRRTLAAIEAREEILAQSWLESERKAEQWAKAELARREKILAGIEAREIAAATAWEMAEKDLAEFPRSSDSKEVAADFQGSPVPKKKLRPEATKSIPRARTTFLDAAIARADGFIPDMDEEMVLSKGDGSSPRSHRGDDGSAANGFVYEGSPDGGGLEIIIKPGPPLADWEKATVDDSPGPSESGLNLVTTEPPLVTRVDPLLRSPIFPAASAENIEQARMEATLGKTALRDNDFGQALVHYRKAYQFDPTNLDHIHNAASLTLAAKEEQKALPVFRQAARLAALAGRGSDAALYNYQISQILAREPEWVEQKLAEAGAIPQDKADIVSILSNLLELAISHAEVGKLPQAINLGKQALGLAQKNLGKSHAVAIMAERQLGEIILQQGDVAGAKSLFNKAVEHATLALGADHPETLTAYALLANLYEQKMELDKAAEILTLIQNSYNKGLGADHPVSLRNSLSLARIYLNLGQSKKGEALLRESCLSYERSFGFQHPDTADCIVQYAASAFSQGAFPVAVANYQQATGILSGSLAEGDPALLESQTGLAKAYHQQGRYREAKQLIATVIRLGEAKPEDNAQLLDEAHLTQARLLMDEGKSKEAESLTGN
jgi:TPR repeat protein/Tfp pilus assembly protein PilF